MDEPGTTLTVLSPTPPSAAPVKTTSPTPIACTNFRFLISLDEFPTDVMYTLKVNQEDSIWDEQPWSQGDTGKLFVNELCLDSLKCYTFTIVDASEDGLTKAPMDGKAGSFVGEYGSQVIGSYDGANDGCYTQITYTFGQCTPSTISVPTDGSCGTDSTGTSIEDTPTCNDKELELYFSLTTDNNPSDLLFTIVNLGNGETIWQEGPWQTDDEKLLFDTPQNLTKQFCYDLDDCFTFWIDDFSEDGMTSGEVRGHFEIQLNGEVVASYSGETDGCFTSKSYTFGSCEFTEETAPGVC